MPELPDIEVYLSALEARILGRSLVALRITSPFLLRTAVPAPESVVGRRVHRLRRLGKRIAIGFDDQYWLVLHLMIAGRLQWRDPGAKGPGRRALAELEFENGRLFVTEAGTRKRASLHVVQGDEAMQAMDPGGLQVLEIGAAEFARALTEGSHTLKRALTDPRIFSGIGNAYSDEILHRARLSPVTLSTRLSADEIERLRQACRTVLREWTDKLRSECGEGFPTKVTAFREDMSVHGRYGQPCPDCATPVQRIRYASNETNYCPRCQTGGRVLADRALSRLLKKDWPRTVEQLEAL